LYYIIRRCRRIADFLPANACLVVCYRGLLLRRRSVTHLLCLRGLGWLRLLPRELAASTRRIALRSRLARGQQYHQSRACKSIHSHLRSSFLSGYCTDTFAAEPCISASISAASFFACPTLASFMRS